MNIKNVTIYCWIKTRFTRMQNQVLNYLSINKHNAFLSNIFPTFKKDGSSRVILNLKELNEYIIHIHFQMDSIKDVIQLIFPNCYFMTVDLKDAYFSVFIKPKDRIWLQFFWNSQCYRFTCLPQGLTSAPRIFTKLLKQLAKY